MYKMTIDFSCFRLYNKRYTLQGAAGLCLLNKETPGVIMGTIQITATLFQLQQLDIELDRLVFEQQAVTTSLQGNTRLRRIRKEMEYLQQQLQAGQQAQEESEWTLEDLSRRLQQKEERLYNGTITNPKELQSLQHEVQQLRAQYNRQEERVLEALDTTEALKEALQQKQNDLKKAEELWQSEYNGLIMRQSQLDARKQDFAQKRQQLVAHLTEDLLTRYDTMRRSKQGRAVSKVEQNSCQWCRVILTPSELQHVRRSEQLQTCTNCGRILYYDRQ
jgi:predicted  nucleic acid-binding Zn-ribbon protein